MHNIHRRHQHRNNQNITKEISKELWFGKKYIIQGRGEGNNREALKKANEDILNELITKLPENLTLALSKMIPIVLKENSKSELFKKKDLLNLLKEKTIQKPQFPKIQLKGFKSIMEDKKFKTSSRLVCGLGSANVLETSITLHHIYGIPYIPASSFKGVCREVLFWDLVEKKQITDETQLKNLQNQFYGKLSLDDEDVLSYQLLFGAQDFKGLLLFLDVYPVFSNEQSNINNFFDLDIMNPHYGGYYSDTEGKTAPGDWENPVPILFLAVKEGIEFEFNVFFDQWCWESIKETGFTVKRDKDVFKLCFGDKYFFDNEQKNITINKVKIESLVNSEKFLSDIVKKALETYGIGSKRAVGYGYFKV